MIIDTTVRSSAEEIMDNFSMEGEILRDALDKIASINRLLGGNKITLEGVELLLKKQNAKKLITIADLGCGNGDMLRMLADFAIKNGRQVELTGIDANDFTVKHAESLSTAYPNIHYKCIDIFSEEFSKEKYDIILCTLTLHHFKDKEIYELLNNTLLKAKIGFVINDLHRSAVAYYLFKALCFVFRLNSMSKDDGLVSILRGFKKSDLQHFSKQLNLSNYTLKWKWAFRYQWIVETL